MLDLDHELLLFPFLSDMSLAVGVILTASLVVIAEDRRTLLSAVGLQYMIVGLLFSQLIPPQLVAVKVLAGLVSCLILFVTSFQTGWYPMQVDVLVRANSNASSIKTSHAEQADYRQPWIIGSKSWFRIFAVIMMALIGLTLQTRYTSLSPEAWFPPASDGMIMAIMQLICLGLLALGMTEDPVRVGLGLLTVLTGFGLFYSLVEPAIAVMAQLAAVEVLVALGTSYLASVNAHRQEATPTGNP